MRLDVSMPSIMKLLGRPSIVNMDFIFLGDGVIKLGNPKTKIEDVGYVGFKTKGLDKFHAEISLENRKFRIRDTASVLGTYLNGMRLSKEREESKWFNLEDGDEITLGYSQKSILKPCNHISMTFEELNKNGSYIPTKKKMVNPETLPLAEDFGDLMFPECCICLEDIKYRQALLVPSCSHTLHYDCARQLIATDPGYFCPVCRSFSHLSITNFLTPKQAHDTLCSAIL
ncbi:hypothetical protein F4703DRAFT_1935479 [Phycomyces blakesleeanus]